LKRKAFLRAFAPGSGKIPKGKSIISPRAAGVSFAGVTAGTPFSVVVSGSYLVELGAAANAGDEVQSDANGKAIPLASGKSNGVLLGSGTTGDKVPMVIK
jgi:hypothetical protein